jgi:hypothetical protein
MYHLLISGNSESWDGQPWDIRTKELSRCITEYTDPVLTKKYSALGPGEVNELRRYPCIFAYESGCRKDPKFGVNRDVTRRASGVRVEYEIRPLDPFITFAQVEEMSFSLDIGEWELNRTHWALKDVDLARELHTRGIALPSWARLTKQAKDITSHQFSVALSFPGEVRPYVARVAGELERLIGPDSYFYDDNYTSQLARPSLDTLLQDLYGNRSRLLVVFLSDDYQSKKWCGIEFRSIRDVIHRKEYERVMYVKMDDGQVDGVFPSDGFVDGRRHSPDEVARFIVERLTVM